MHTAFVQIYSVDSRSPKDSCSALGSVLKGIHCKFGGSFFFVACSEGYEKRTMYSYMSRSTISSIGRFYAQNAEIEFSKLH